MEKKRVPVRIKTRRYLLALCAVSVLVTGLISIIGMLLNQTRVTAALEEQAMRNLSGIVSSKAELADSAFGRYADYITFLSDYIHLMYLDREAYLKTGRDVPVPDPATPKGVCAMQRTLTSKDVKYENVREDARLFSNLENIYSSIMTENSEVISTIYSSLDNGLMVAYDGASYLALPKEGETENYFNFKERPWYQEARDKGTVIFTDVYTDDYGRGLNITCSAPFYDENNKFAGVVSADFLITDLYNTVVDMNLGEGAYTFMVDDSGNIISPDGAQSSLNESDMDEFTRQQMTTKQTGVNLSGNGVYYAYTPVPAVNWELGIYMPKKLMMQPVERMQSGFVVLIIILVAVFLLILVIVSLISRRFSDSLTAPVLRLTEDVKQISAGHLDHRASVNGDDEISILASSFNNMTIALQKHIDDLTKVTAEQERIRAELDVAARIQKDMLLSVFPDHPDFDVYASMTPAREVGGDFYDSFLIDNEHLAIVMADVSGKGVPAALFMTKACNLIRTRAKSGGYPDEILSDVNRQLCEENNSSLFVTVWLGILNLKTGELNAVSAGHEYPCLRRAGGKYELVAAENDPPLGTDSDLALTLRKTVLSPGDALFVYTDGVSDARNKTGERYGRERMLNILNEAEEGDSSRRILDRISEDVRKFTEDVTPFDDITMLSMIYLEHER